MKRFLLSALTIGISITVFCQTECPTNFTRNNGNNGGCASHFRLYFTTCPASIPTLDSLKIDGVRQPETFTLFSVSCSGTANYVDYCVSDNNLVPVGLITAYLTYYGDSAGSRQHKVCNLSSPTVLPAALVNFEVQRSNSTVSVTWQTQQENYVSHFEIERAYGTSSFQKIGNVDAEVNPGKLMTHTFSDDANISREVSYYRIKMIDKNGFITYTPTKTITGSGEKLNFIIFPNPSHGIINITVNDVRQPVEVQLIDLSGRLLKSVNLNGSNTTRLNDLPDGSYFVRVTGKASGETSIKKLSVLK